MLAESTLAERAARHPDAHARRVAMEPYLEPPPDGAEDDGAELVAAHLAFHTQVASLAENRVLEIVLQTVGQIVAGHSVVTAEVAANSFAVSPTTIIGSRWPSMQATTRPPAP